MKLVRRAVAKLVPAAVARRYKFIMFLVFILNRLFQMLPLRVSFLLAVGAEVVRLPGRRGIYLALRPVVAAAVARRPDFRVAGVWGKSRPFETAHVLYGIGSFGEVCEFINSRGLSLGHPAMCRILGRSQFELGNFAEARSAIDATYSMVELDFDPNVAGFKAELDLIAGEENQALANLHRAVRIPRNLCPHQNLAARYPSIYVPTTIDLECGDEGRLFDACNYTGQRVTHVGEGHLGAALFARALQAQQYLRAEFPELSPELQKWLKTAGIALEELRIIPVEWYTQIGHLGMMDILFRMKELGWWRGHAVFLVPLPLVANRSFLRLFERYGVMLTPGGSIPPPVANELFSLQRWSGMAFNAFALPGGDVVPWQEAGALAMQQWQREGRGHPLREEFDRVLGSSITVRRRIDLLREEWGLKPDDWYICLHLRDGAHYGELSGTGQTHRNAQVSSYIDMMTYITGKGGWVIKLGGPKSPKLPDMPRVVDYARSIHRSEVVDLDLIRHARLFVGTTSGLTNVAISFGVPCALVNCITTDAQLWNNRVRFVLKPVVLKDGTRLSQRDLTSAPWRWRVFDAEVLGRHGAVPLNNTADEILETVKEVEALALGRSDAYLASIPQSDEWLRQWRADLALPYFYGDALPGRYGLGKCKGHLESHQDNAVPAERADIALP